MHACNKYHWCLSTQYQCVRIVARSRYIQALENGQMPEHSEWSAAEQVGAKVFASSSSLQLFDS